MPPSATATPNMRGGALDALRFLAAFLIVVYHYVDQAPLEARSLPAVFGRGYLATDFFLMLSGYVLARAYGPKLSSAGLSWRQFMGRRLRRIWPAHAVVLAGFVLVVAAAAALGASPQDPALFRWPTLAAQVFLVQAWGALPGEMGWNTVTWSLSALLACYAAFPFVWRAQARLGSAWGLLLLALTVLVGADLAVHAVFGQSLYDLPIRTSLFRAAPLFTLGIAVARLAAERPLGPRAATSVGLGALALLFALQAVGRFDLPSIVCIAAVILAAGSRPVPRPWPLTALGARLSFSLFLTHLLVATVWFGGAHAVAERTWPHWMQWAIWWSGFPLALAAAAVFDRFVDQPIQRWLNRAGGPARRRRPPDGVPATATQPI